MVLAGKTHWSASALSVSPSVLFIDPIRNYNLDYLPKRFKQASSPSTPEETHQMFGDPRACREHARRCSELAVLAATPEEREHLLSLESVWIRRAAELESAEAFLKTMDEIHFKPPYPPEAA
jgi:hypothetical protein